MLTACTRYSKAARHPRTWAIRRVHTDDKRWPGWQVVIGIEVHAQIKSRRKLFSESLTSNYSQAPNTQVTPFDAAFPGTLPHLNANCVDLAIRTALALNANVQRRSYFDRKHYFYSDLPAGYQITQRYFPIAVGGSLPLPAPFSKPVNIVQIQLEQDTAKSTFDARRRISHVDLNRAGVGLMEIVSQPDMRSPEEAAAYVQSLQSLLRSVGSSDGNMEQGSLRCDVNVSVNRPGEPFGTRCEIKNLNSVKFMTIAIISEINRQTAFLEANPGKQVPQETRGFSERLCETYKLRSKDDSPDYRYMPDPNLPPLIIPESRLERVRQILPELPAVSRTRMMAQYGLSGRDVDVIMTLESGREVPFDGELNPDNSGALLYFESLCSGQGRDTSSKLTGSRDPKLVVNWMTHELLGQLHARQQTFNQNPIPVTRFGQLIDMVADNTTTRMSARLLLRYLLDHPEDQRPLLDIAQAIGLVETSADASSLEEICKAVISNMHSEVAAARAGNLNVLNKLVGRVIKQSKGRIDAREARRCLEGFINE